MKQKIIEYLTGQYQPSAILLYGSYAVGTNDAESDFDCMIIVAEKQKNHDASVINGVQLDCYIFTEEETQNEEPDTFLTAYDAELVLDHNGIAAALQSRVREYVHEHTVTDPEEKAFIAGWIDKTCRRISKDADEAKYRAFVLMGESLCDYYLLRDMFYFGSKRAVRYLQEHDEQGYRLFHAAVNNRDDAAMIAWFQYVAGI